MITIKVKQVVVIKKTMKQIMIVMIKEKYKVNNNNNNNNRVKANYKINIK